MMLFFRRCYSFFIVFSSIFFIAGCSEPIRTLQALGVEKDAQIAQVERQNIKFELLLNAIRQGRLKPGARYEKVVARYGRAVLEEVLPGQDKVILLYRKPTQFFDTAKIYLIFDKDRNLEKIEIEEPDADKSR